MCRSEFFLRRRQQRRAFFQRLDDETAAECWVYNQRLAALRIAPVLRAAHRHEGIAAPRILQTEV
jgi:hypothetical protein